jgi:hypothetical protein
MVMSIPDYGYVSICVNYGYFVDLNLAIIHVNFEIIVVVFEFQCF